MNNTASANMPKYCYRKYDTLFAWLVIALFMCFYDGIMQSSLGLASTAFMLVLYGGTAVYLRISEVKLSGSWYFLALGCLLSISFFFTDNGFVKGVVFLFDAFVYVIWLLYSCKNNANGFDMLWYDSLKAMFVMPFSSIGRLFGAAAGGENGRGKGKIALMILGGVFAAVIPSIIVTLLLCSADGGFNDLVLSLKGNFTDVLGDIFTRCIVCVCLSCLVFGAMYSNVRHFYQPSFSAERNNLRRTARAVLPPSFVYAAATPMLVVYAVFFGVQFRYFTSAFSSTLPDGVDNYAQFARRGFFELCVVAVINTVVILLISSYTKRPLGKKPMGARVYCVIYSAASLVFTAIVLSKMILYIKKFGLSQLRVYTTLFMLMIGVLFILVIIRQVKESFNMMAFAAVTVAVFSLVFAFGRFDRIIADYNVDAYLDGRLESIDTDMLHGISRDAYPAVKRLYENADDPAVRNRAQIILDSMDDHRESRRPTDMNITDFYSYKK